MQKRIWKCETCGAELVRAEGQDTRKCPHCKNIMTAVLVEDGREHSLERLEE